MGIRPMAAGTRHANFGPGAETNPYLKRERQTGNNLIPANM